MFIEAIGIAARLLATPLSPAVELHVPHASAMMLGEHVAAPIGYVRFCQRRPDQCGEGSSMQAPLRLSGPSLHAASPDLYPNAITGGEPASSETRGSDSRALPPAPIDFAAPQGVAVIHLTEESWSALNSINQGINDKLHPMSDEQAFGVSNYWTLPIEDEHRAVGNCKHYALEKRKALVDAGLSADALSLAIVRTGSGELHAVLVVATDHGEMVLDNLSGRIKGWRDARYRWLARQTPGRPMDWVSVASPS